MGEIPYGYCQCGCGGKTTISCKSSASKGWKKVEPQKWINAGHKRRAEMRERRKQEEIATENDPNRPYCECGCGNFVNKAKATINFRGIKKGQYYRYLEGHGAGSGPEKRFNRKDDATNCCIDKRTGAILIYDKDHPKVHPGRMIPEAHLIAEAALGKYLPDGACVLHIDRDASNTKNLVVCQDKKYMQLLRQRLVAYENCGHANYRKCVFCHEYGDPKDMRHHTQRSFRHQDCRSKS
jgi:hypothetical protein